MNQATTMYPGGNGGITIHKEFNATDADVTVQSSDGVQFKLHRKYLEAYTGVLPKIINERSASRVWIPAELEEPANVLEVLFLFVYPRRHTDLEDMDFEIVMAVARATEKYEVFAAMHTCERRLSTFIEGHAIEILGHGIQYKYPKLIDEAALVLSRLPSGDVIENAVIAANATAWIKYKDAWKAATLDRTNALLDEAYKNFRPSSSEKSQRALCYLAAYRWMMHLECLTSFPRFLLELELQKTGTQPVGAVQCIEHASAPQHSNECSITMVQECYMQGIESMPPFSNFLEGKKYVPVIKKRPNDYLSGALEVPGHHSTGNN